MKLSLITLLYCNLFALTVVLAEVCSALTTTTTTIVANEWKAPHPTKTPSTQSSQWETLDRELWSYVESNVPAVLDHTGTENFDEHLKGVQAVLRYWEAPEYLCSAGLFHSIYGTEGFQGFALPLSERKTIQQMIGDKAERLAFIFCMVDRSTLDKTVFEWQAASDHPSDGMKYILRARPELGRFDIELDREEWLDFVELTLADWLEQVEGASAKASDLFLWKPGQAYAYRRQAYKRMSEILAVERSQRLSEVAPMMLSAVMATEASGTRNFVQPRTPPMSTAAAAALDALRAIGEDIPYDLSPQIMEDPQCESSW